MAQIDLIPDRCRPDDSPDRTRDFGFILDGAPIHFRKWKSNAEFAEGCFTDLGLHYRGVTFRTGGIPLCNRARASDGIFTTLVEGRQKFGHVAVFALLEGVYPAVLEIHNEGVRAVPLRVFLGDRFTTYLEVYRSTEAFDRDRMAEVAALMLHERHAFDIRMDESQDAHLSCALMAAQLYRRSGAKPPRGTSRYSLETLPNLEILGNTCGAHRDLLMPDDYARAENFVKIGVVDNGFGVERLARGLVRERMQKIWQTRTLNTRAFPKSHLVFSLAVTCVQKGIWPFDLIAARLAGFSVETFPSGPAMFLSLVPIVEPRIERASNFLAKALARLDLSDHATWDTLAADRRVQRLLDFAIADFDSLFTTRPARRAVHLPRRGRLPSPERHAGPS